MQIKFPLLSINIGNSKGSFGYNIDQSIHSLDDSTSIDLIAKYLASSPTPYVIECSVVGSMAMQSRYPKLRQLLNDFFSKSPQSAIDFSKKISARHFSSMPLNYGHTLGMDRLIQSYGLWGALKKSPGSCGLLIDAGTMTTIDVISLEFGHLGGFILPGLSAFSSSFSKADQLPHEEKVKEHLLQSSDPKVHQLLPLDTLSAITYPYWQQMQLMLKELNLQYSFSKTIISGGDAPTWFNFLRKVAFTSKMQLECKPNYAHECLWQIAQDVLI